VAGFDRSIPPGGEGKISIRLYPYSCHGDTKKIAFVFCNDPKNPYFKLTVLGRDY
jgi:hypothetical protein